MRDEKGQFVKGHKMKKTGRYIKCFLCEKIRYIQPSQEKRNKGKFCSRKCHSNYLKGRESLSKKGKKITCKVCQKEKYIKRYLLIKGEGIYCSSKCYGIDKLGKKGYWKDKERPEISGENSGQWKGGEIEKKCKFCNSTFSVSLYRKKTAKYCSHKCYTDDNLGLTPLHEAIRKSTAYKLWRNAVKDRDDYTCQLCGERGGILHADHIKPFSLFPELRFDINNGRTLCKPCHMKTDTYGTKIKVYINKSIKRI